MLDRRVVILASVLTMPLTTSAFALRSETAEVPQRVAHRHHVAKNATAPAANTASDVDRDAGLYVVKPSSEPEYFGHGTGSDGSMP